jgi:hypothetical protein
MRITASLLALLLTTAAFGQPTTTPPPSDYDPALLAQTGLTDLIAQRDALLAEVENLQLMIESLHSQNAELEMQVALLQAEVAELQAWIDNHDCDPPPPPPTDREIALYTSCGDGWRNDEINPRPGLVAAREAVGMTYVNMIGGWFIDRDKDHVFTDADKPRMDEVLLDFDRQPLDTWLCLDWENFSVLHSWWSQPGNQFPAIVDTASWTAQVNEHHKLVQYVRETRPDLKIGHYGIPWREYWRAYNAINDKNPDTVVEWLAADDSLAPILAETDFFAPSAYDHYDRPDDPEVYTRMVEEWLRVAYEHDKPIIACVWHRHHADLTPCSDEEMRTLYTAILEAEYEGKQLDALYCWSGEGYYLDRARMKLDDGSWRFTSSTFDKYRGRYAIEIGENWLNGEWMEQVYAPWYALIGEVRDEVMRAPSSPTTTPPVVERARRLRQADFPDQATVHDHPEYGDGS